MKPRLLVFLLIFFLSDYLNAQTVPPFKAGDRVVFTGNSITDGGHYHSYIWLYYLTHFPNRRIQIFNAGIGGDVAQQMYERLETDVFAKKPTVVTLTFGMNDTGYQALSGDKADSAYRVKIAASLKQHPEVRKIMIGSSPYDETARTRSMRLVGKNAAMRQIATEQQRVANNNKWAYIDLGEPMTAINLREQLRDSMFTLQGSDRIHPTNDAQMVMAWLFLKAQGLAGEKIAAIKVNAVSKKVELAENCTISNPVISADKVSFTYLAKALPYPMDTIPGGFGKPQKTQAEALKIIPFNEEFNQELIQVKGLRAKQLLLKIDGKAIGTYSAEEYKNGINLAKISATPQYQQALAVMHLNEERWTIERRLREYYWIHYSILKPKGLLFNDGYATIDSLQKYSKKDFFVAITLPAYQKARFKPVREAWQKEMDLLTDQLYSINKPVPHRFEITLIN
jgi:lysophospholipase L1-like esterase